MADKILRNKIIEGRRVLSPEPTESTWTPFNVCNDFYPKIVTPSSNLELNSSLFTIYDQKNMFKELELLSDEMVIEPVVSGWGVTFQNITLLLNGNKYVLYNESIQDRNLTFEDSFFRFSSMYTFEDKIDATSEGKLPFLIKSWKYKK